MTKLWNTDPDGIRQEENTGKIHPSAFIIVIAFLISFSCLMWIVYLINLSYLDNDNYPYVITLEDTNVLLTVALIFTGVTFLSTFVYIFVLLIKIKNLAEDITNKDTNINLLTSSTYHPNKFENTPSYTSIPTDELDSNEDDYAKIDLDYKEVEKEEDDDLGNEEGDEKDAEERNRQQLIKEMEKQEKRFQETEERLEKVLKKLESLLERR